MKKIVSLLSLLRNLENDNFTRRISLDASQCSHFPTDIVIDKTLALRRKTLTLRHFEFNELESFAFSSNRRNMAFSLWGFIYDSNQPRFSLYLAIAKRASAQSRNTESTKFGCEINPSFSLFALPSRWMQTCDRRFVRARCLFLCTYSSSLHLTESVGLSNSFI